jgi:hypothetical protein
MSWKIMKYRHPAICVQNGEGKTYDLRICDDGTISEPSSVDDDRDPARIAAITHLRGYRRWFGHWIPIDPRPLESAPA